jgi:hypothetical protein
MDADALRSWLGSLEAALGGPERPELAPALAYMAGQEVELDADELRGALRRAVLLLAAGGDPTRELDVDGRAVRALAAELDAAERRAQLSRGLASLGTAAARMPLVQEEIALLERDPELAWRWFAASLIADELGEGD